MVNIQMEGTRWVPIDNKEGNEHASVGKMQVKRITMATTHGSLPPGTCHTEISVEIDCIIKIIFKLKQNNQTN